MSDTELSKFLSYVLRHKPDEIGLVLDAQGWASISELLERASAHDRPFTRDDLLRVVAKSDKQRFALSDDQARIRANHGHSLTVDLGIKPATPPALLFHGTATRFYDSILAEGLKPQSRQMVHLCETIEQAKKVGERHGKPLILKVDAAALSAKGVLFYPSQSHVWLVEGVPPAFLSL